MRDHVQRLQIAGDDEPDGSFDTSLAQPGIDWVLALAASDHSDMPGTQELIQSTQARSHGVTAPDRDHLGVGEETLPVKAREGLAGARDNEIDRTGQLGGHAGWAEPGRDIEPDMRRLRDNSFQQRRHDEIDDMIGHHDREAAGTGSRIEGLGYKKTAYLIERVGKWRSQRLRARR